MWCKRAVQESLFQHFPFYRRIFLIFHLFHIFDILINYNQQFLITIYFVSLLKAKLLWSLRD